MEPENPPKTATFGTSMECPVCKINKTKVIDKRNESDHIMRRRQCANNHRFTTFELDASKPGITKRGSVDTMHPDFAEKMKNALAAAIDYQKLAHALYIK